MPGRYRVIDVARAAEMDRRQIEALIARGLIVPEHTPEEGGARQFTEEEAIKIAVLGEVMRLKVPAIQAVDAVKRLLFSRMPSALVLYHGFVELVQSSPRHVPLDENTGRSGVYVRSSHVHVGEADANEGGRLFSEVVHMDELGEFLAGPEIAAAVVVPLDPVERRVKRHLGTLAPR